MFRKIYAVMQDLQAYGFYESRTDAVNEAESLAAKHKKAFVVYESITKLEPIMADGVVTSMSQSPALAPSVVHQKYGTWSTGPSGQFITQPFHAPNGDLVAIGLLIFDEEVTGWGVAASLITPPRGKEFNQRCEANALLIAAAPDLFHACVAAISDIPPDRKSAKKLRRAISKAAGSIS